MRQDQLDKLYANKKLGKLLEIERSEEEKEQINQILKANSDIERRIELIEALDKEKNRNGDQAAITGAGGASAEKSGKRKNIESVGFFQFLFGTRKELSDFASKTGVVKPKLFGTQFELGSEAISLLRERRAEKIAVFFKKINGILPEAWKLITILHFNVLVMFSRVIEGYYVLASAVQDGKRDASELLRISEKFFSSLLTLEQDKKYRKQLHEAIGIAFAKDEGNTEKELLALAQFFFDGRKGSCSFDDLLLGMIAVKNKKLPTVAELDMFFGITKISEKEYYASPELKLKIDNFYNNINGELLQIEDRLRLVQMIRKELLSQNENGKFTFPLFRQILSLVFQESGVFGDKLKKEIQHVIGNAVLLMKETLAFFGHHLTSIMQQDISVASNPKGRVRIFVFGLFTADLNAIFAALGELEKFIKKYPSFEYSFHNYYDNLKNPSDDPIQQKAAELCSNGVNKLYELGERILQVLENQSFAEKQLLKSKGKIGNTANEPIDNFSDKARLIPHFREKIVTEGALKGMSVMGAIIEIAKVCYNVALLYRHEILLQKLKEENNLMAQRNKLQKSLGNRQ